MTHKDMLTNLYTKYASDPMVRFIGYNTLKGSRMYGTLNNIPDKQCVEMPVAENLMIGLAIGMSLEGYKPVVCFERHDFMLLALDGLVNHVDKLPKISGYQYKLPILVRAIVGSASPLNPGPQHTQNYYQELKSMLKHTPVFDASMMRYEGLVTALRQVGVSESGAVVIVEKRDNYVFEPV